MLNVYIITSKKRTDVVAKARLGTAHIQVLLKWLCGIEGLMSKLEDPEFISYLKAFLFVCLFN